MALLIRQVLVLVQKNLLIAAVRRPISTLLRALIFPLALVLLVTYAQYFFNPPQQFGIGTATPILSFSEALSRSSPSRNTIAIIVDAYASDDMLKVVKSLSDEVQRAPGKQLFQASDETLLSDKCEASVRGTSKCYGAVVFHSSPNFPQSGGNWNYTLRADSSLGKTFDVTRQKNDAQIYLMPFQQAIDHAITTQTPEYHGRDLSTVTQYPFTTVSEEQRESDTRQSYLQSGISYFGVVYFLGMVGVVYQLTGLIAYERESGLAQLVEAMMPNTQRWLPQVLRLFTYHFSFSILYFPSWLAIGIILAAKVFTFTDPAITIVYHILAGLALCSFSIFGAVFFKRAQLSGICVVVVVVVLAIIPQVLSDPKQTPATVFALSLFFPSSNYTYFLVFILRWEYKNLGAKLDASAPDSPWKLHGSNFWIFLVLQIIVYPLAAVGIERAIFATSSNRRILHKGHRGLDATVQLRDFSKTYKPSLFARLFTSERKQVDAVRNLDLSARQGQILMLLGPNGSGKSTTLDAIAGLSKVSNGQIEVDGSGGLGVTPQKNILWDDLTVREHVKIFHNLKATDSRGTEADVRAMLNDCDIDSKAAAKSKTLSGGQKRKVQLAMMFAGGSAVCCVDEVSSGLDPLSRRKIWDILLAQRSSRTIIMTTHFLDEADFLSDHIAILSKGTLKAEGSSAELKQRYGNGYVIETVQPLQQGRGNLASDRQKKSHATQTLHARDAAEAANLVDNLSSHGHHDCKISGPTLEDVFLRLAGSSLVTLTSSDPNAKGSHQRDSGHQKSQEVIVNVDELQDINLHNGSHVHASKQMWLLFIKRLLVFRRKWGPHLSALIVALIGAGVSPLLLHYFNPMNCAVSEKTKEYAPPSAGYLSSFATLYEPNAVGGPPSPGYSQSLSRINDLYPSVYTRRGQPDPTIFQNLYNVSSLQDFNARVAEQRQNLDGGGFWLGDATSAPVIAWNAYSASLFKSVVTQNVMNNLLSNIGIVTTYSDFVLPLEPDTYAFSALLFSIYFCLVFAIYPAFYALYPTVERLRQARALQYSNGVKSKPMWLAYFAFDSLHVIVISVISTALLSLGTKHWIHLGYIFVVLVLYGFASTILGYLISMFAKSQLAAWALCASGQVVMCLAYFGAYLGVQTRTGIADLSTTLGKVQNSIGFISPVANLQRAVFVALNQFLIDCGKLDSPGAFELYGGPIFYLILQCLILFAILFLWDSGFSPRMLFKRYSKQRHAEDAVAGSVSQSMELRTLGEKMTGLRVTNLSKSFGRNVAVDDVSFDIKQSEVFALLGPNGAGKSTAISLIRGDIRPSSSLSAVHVDNISLFTHRDKTRAHLGVCPQFDATDVLSVYEHIKFYAQIRGVSSPTHNANELIRVFGLEPYRHQLAYKLSGGTKRKLSLAIAMAGNPSVLLLDEPSSGLDAASKRAMWKTLAAVSAGRSILLTTHSMEEADALADRAGIMSGRILAMDTCDALRRRWGDVYHVHLVTNSAPYTGVEEMKKLKMWVRTHFEGARLDEKTYCGQLRFSVPARRGIGGLEGGENEGGGVANLFRTLESNKAALGVKFYSVGETSLDQVFVNVVREHGGMEEGDVGHEGKKKWLRWW
ncbi:uncharacterized protein KY384_005681 [Bacidia gigantensis]|uniref:uncharacterized protein n=1 Tax=Bacidia gigantensis TaxID=2732470 RepID=UPI001D045508|nr:uncharacterized protein KY384_005681 [Bacidia gigantensis]KAG8529047.1 hypothetical protein KY384_005681 [Bacidia gigantensis]